MWISFCLSLSASIHFWLLPSSSWGAHFASSHVSQREAIQPRYSTSWSQLDLFFCHGIQRVCPQRGDVAGHWKMDGSKTDESMSTGSSGIDTTLIALSVDGFFESAFR